MRFFKQLFHDSWRVCAMLVVSLLILIASPIVGGFLDGPWLHEHGLNILLPGAYIATYGNWMAFLFAGIAASHVMRKFLAPHSSFSGHLQGAKEGKLPDAIASVAHALIIAAFILASKPASGAEIPIPPAAKKFIPVLLQAQRTYWPQMLAPSLLAAQVAKENPRWNPRACLKTSREQGCGLGQVTRTLRFDALAELVAAYPQALAGWSWDKPSLYDPALQLRAVVLKDKQNADRVKGAADQTNQVLMAFYAYNAGPGNLSSDRMACRATRGCDPGKWFGHVELTTYRKAVTVPGYGGRSFLEISHEYVATIAHVLQPRYARAMGES